MDKVRKRNDLCALFLSLLQSFLLTPLLMLLMLLLLLLHATPPRIEEDEDEEEEGGKRGGGQGGSRARRVERGVKIFRYKQSSTPLLPVKFWEGGKRGGGKMRRAFINMQLS